MAALDLDELLQQKAAAQSAAQDAANQKVQLHEELQKVCHICLMGLYLRGTAQSMCSKHRLHPLCHNSVSK